MDAHEPHHPDGGRVEPVDQIQDPGRIPGELDPLGIVAQWACYQKELFQGVMDTRTKLQDSYFVLVSAIALLHFLTYIHFLCLL